MARTVDLAVHGGPELDAALNGMKRDLSDMRALNMTIAGDLARAVAALAPKVSGALAGSCRPSATPNRAKVVSDLIYAPVIQHGWPAHNIEGQHFGERALTQMAGTIQKKYDDGLAQMCKKAES